VPRARKSDSLIGWTTITYRSVLLMILGVLLLVGIAFYFIFPEQSKAGLAAAGDLMSRVVNRITGGQPKVQPHTGQQQANFTVMEGTVRVKKHDSSTWVSADFNLPLEKGDVVQTGPEGMARIVFADQSSYVVKQDSLIVIEENSMNQKQQTEVTVQVTTGTVDLQTATFTQGSKSGVIATGATATFAQESSAQVRIDPKVDKNEIVVTKGAGEVTRGDDKVRLGAFERVSFTQDSPHLVKSKEIGPPVLIAPANMYPIFTGADVRPIDFSWALVTGSKIYRIRISRNPYFSSTLYDKKVATTSVKVPGLKEGAYYWVVQSIDGSGRESVESEKNRFTIISKGSENASISLDLEPFVQHGHIIEVRGKTESNARVMVNGAEVSSIVDGKFQYFTPPLPDGESLITVTAQNSRGGVRTQQKKVVIQ
jgi:quercetin dioxygenase-like cupin family protein